MVDIIAPDEAFRLLLCAHYPHLLEFADQIRSYDWIRWKISGVSEINQTAAREAMTKFTTHIRDGSIRLHGSLTRRNSLTGKELQEPPEEIPQEDCRDGELHVFDRVLKIHRSPQTFEAAYTYLRVYCVKADVLKIIDASNPRPSLQKAVEPQLKKPGQRASLKQIKAIVGDYRKSLKGKATASIAKLEQFAKNFLRGHREELRAEFHNQFPNRRAGRPRK